MKTKRGAITDHLVEIIIAVAVLVLLVIISILFKDKAFSLIDKVKEFIFGAK